MIPGIIIALSAANAATARPPPSTCDPTEIQECLSRFEKQFAECDQNDLSCQCSKVITSGANCYAACPQDAMTKFIQTYNEGRCANFDPFLHRRNANHGTPTEQPAYINSTGHHNALKSVGSAKMDALTVVPSEPTTTISLSPPDYHSILEKSRYKENLRSIRSERARLSSEAADRLAMPSAQQSNNNKDIVASVPAVASASRPTASNNYVSATEAPEVIQISGGMQAKLSAAILVTGLICLFL